MEDRRFILVSEIEAAVKDIECSNLSRLNDVLISTATLFNKENRLTQLCAAKHEIEIVDALKTGTSAKHCGFYIEQVLDAYLNVIKNIGMLNRKVSYVIPFTNKIEDIMHDLTRVLITPVNYETKKIGATMAFTYPINFLYMTLYGE